MSGHIPGAIRAGALQPDLDRRRAAIAAATDARGEGGSKMRGAGMAAALAASDTELFSSPA